MTDNISLIFPKIPYVQHSHDRKTVFGNKKNSYYTDLMKAIIVNIRNGSGESVKKSQNVLIAMLEELISKKDAAEKKRILVDEYGMVMTAELERRIQIEAENSVYANL